MRTKKWVKSFFKKEADIVRNGLELSEFPFTPRVALASSHVKLLSTGIFFVHRRYEDIIRAVKLLQEKGVNVVLSIVGNYSGEHHRYYEMLNSLVDELGLQGSIFFLGNISDSELRRQYKENDIYISANHLQSWGLAPFEAIASGMPAIISNSTGAAEVLKNREHALLISPKSPEKIMEAVIELVSHPDLYMRLSTEARRFVEENLTWKNTAQAFAKVFQDVTV